MMSSLKSFLSVFGALLVVCAISFALAQDPSGQNQFLKSQYPQIQTNLVTFPITTLDGKTLMATGKLQIPRNLKGRGPAVLILHGSGGMDSRGTTHALDLNRAGMVTLELDLWGPRGFSGGAGSRSKHPTENLPDVYGAYDFLAALPNVDAERIGITGFSWGGVLSLITATRPITYQYGAGRRFAAHLSFYPAVCWGLNKVPGFDFKSLNGANVRLLVGALDRYEADPESCPKMVAALEPRDKALVSVKVYPNAEHGFNMLEAPVGYTDPYINQGKGGEGRSAPNAAARLDSRLEMVRFFLKNLGKSSATMPAKPIAPSLMLR
jgi:uncharacterized protein